MKRKNKKSQITHAHSILCHPYCSDILHIVLINESSSRNFPCLIQFTKHKHDLVNVPVSFNEALFVHCTFIPDWVARPSTTCFFIISSVSVTWLKTATGIWGGGSPGNISTDVEVVCATLFLSPSVHHSLCGECRAKLASPDRWLETEPAVTRKPQ
jgi:hypothetical protein